MDRAAPNRTAAIAKFQIRTRHRVPIRHPKFAMQVLPEAVGLMDGRPLQNQPPDLSQSQARR